MIDITRKPTVYREAKAKGLIKLKPETISRILEGKIEKGDPLQISKIAGIMAAKNTSQIIPLCHPIPISHVDIITKIVSNDTIKVESTVKSTAKTGVEMEALTATTLTLLTIWDMTKKYEKNKSGQYPTTEVSSVHVEYKKRTQTKDKFRKTAK